MKLKNKLKSENEVKSENKVKIFTDYGDICSITRVPKKDVLKVISEKIAEDFKEISILKIDAESADERN